MTWNVLNGNVEKAKYHKYFRDDRANESCYKLVFKKEIIGMKHLIILQQLYTLKSVGLKFNQHWTRMWIF